MELSTSSTAVIACHFQNDVVGADGAFAPFFRAEVERRGVLDVAGRVLDAARNAGAQVVLARVAFKDGHSDLVTNIPLLGVVAQQGSLLDGSHGAALVEEVKTGPDDWDVANPKVSAFASSDLDSRLRAAGVDTVVLMGVASNISVESTGRAAGDLGYRVVIVEDACSAATQEVHDASMATFGLLGEVVSSDELIAAL